MNLSKLNKFKMYNNNNNANNLQRQSANFAPSVWGDFFITYAPHNRNFDAWREEAKTLKEKVQKMVKQCSDLASENIGEKIRIIDAIQRLGISYHFEMEIQEILYQICKNFNDEKSYRHYELVTLANLFRILRQHGYNVSCDIFNNKLKDKKNNGFKEEISEDIEGMISLYEATQVRLDGESILEEAFMYCKSRLELKAPYLTNKPYLRAHVSHTLKWRIQKCIPRLGAREYISFYQHDEAHNNYNQILLKFAKLDFNLLQLQHQEELYLISNWWKDLDVKKKLPYARDRITECYFWILGVYYEPQFSLARKFSVKVIALTSLLDDTYDASHATYDELLLLTQAFQRWDISAMDELPEYMKAIYRAMLEAYSEMEEELVKEGRSYAISYAIEAMKMQVKAYLEESKWLVTKKVPSMEEYIKVALPSTGYPLMTVVSLVGMGEFVTKESFDWVISEPYALQSVNRLCRFMDDIVSHEMEREREHIPSAVECYMKEYNVSALEACNYLTNEVKNAWMDQNQALLDPKRPSMSVLGIVLNLTRVMELLYSGEDIYTHPKKMKPYVASLLVNPIDI